MLLYMKRSLTLRIQQAIRSKIMIWLAFLLVLPRSVKIALTLVMTHHSMPISQHGGNHKLHLRYPHDETRQTRLRRHYRQPYTTSNMTITDFAIQTTCRTTTSNQLMYTSPPNPPKLTALLPPKTAPPLKRPSPPYHVKTDLETKIRKRTNPENTPNKRENELISQTHPELYVAVTDIRTRFRCL